MRTLCFYALLLFVPASLFAQTAVSPVQQPAARPVAPSSQDSVFTLKASTRRVLVDVVVKDKKGNPVHGLKATDFLVTESGQPQQVHDFDEHSAISIAEAAAAPKFPHLPPGEFSNFTPVPQTGTLSIVLIDRLNTSQGDQLYLQQQLTDYLRHARPDSRTAIYGLTDRLLVLQGFTSDPEILLAAINRNKNPQASPLKDDAFGNAGKEDLSNVIEAYDRLGPVAHAAEAAVAAFQGDYQQFQGQIRSKLTLDALNQIGRAMVTLPGRKNLIWFAGTFPPGFFPEDAGTEFAELADEYRDTVNLMTSAQVAIYPVDAQGLRTFQNNDAAFSNARYARGENPGLFVAGEIAGEASGIDREHLGMEKIARETGGEAFFNSNNLVKAVDNAIGSGSNFYSIAYVPTNTARTPVFRAITVKLNGQHFALSYRRGYYTEVEGQKPVPALAQGAGAAAAPPPPAALSRALLQSGPEPTEILLRVRATPATRGGDAAVVKGNQPNPSAFVSHGPYQQFEIGFAASARALSFKHGADGRYRSDLDFVTYVYNSHGILVNAQSNTFRASYSAQQVAELVKSGVPFAQRVSVPDSGDYFLRVAVHDNVSDKVGAVEIPVSSIRRLPLFAEAQPATVGPASSPAP